MTLYKLTPEKKKAMLRLARKARDAAYAPYSHHPVGAAVLSGTGRLYAGANCEFVNYDVNCAESTAIVAMAAAGERRIKAVLVIGPREAGGIITPCGRCRQRILEFADDKTVIVCVSGDGRREAVFSMADMLPFSFFDSVGEVQGKKKRT